MRRTSSLRGATAVCAAALLAAAPAQARQLNPRREPHRSGPLIASGHACNSTTIRLEGRVVARTGYCAWLYDFDPLMEIDLRSDYGAVWLHTSIDPVDGWCVTKVVSRISVPPGVRIESAAPGGRPSLRRPRSLRARLRLDAGGAALDEALIHQTARLFPRSVGLSVKGRGARLVWRGRTPRTVAFPLGAETSWDLTDPPGGDYRVGLGPLRFVKARGC